MFEQLFTCPRTVKRYTDGPLLEERLRYLAHCAAHGSTRSSLRLIAQHQLVLIDYLHLETADSITIQQIEAAAKLRVKRQPQLHTHNATDYRYAKLRVHLYVDERGTLGVNPFDCVIDHCSAPDGCRR